MILTHELIEAGASRNGGWNGKQLALFGIKFPLPKGWKKELAGTEVPDEIYYEFVALKNKHLREDKKMRSTEYLHSVKHGIQEKELYSHLDIQDKKLRRKIAKDRRKVKQYVYPEQKEF